MKRKIEITIDFPRIEFDSDRERGPSDDELKQAIQGLISRTNEASACLEDGQEFNSFVDELSTKIRLRNFKIILQGAKARK